MKSARNGRPRDQLFTASKNNRPPAFVLHALLPATICGSGTGEPTYITDGADVRIMSERHSALRCSGSRGEWAFPTPAASAKEAREKKEQIPAIIRASLSSHCDRSVCFCEVGTRERFLFAKREAPQHRWPAVDDVVCVMPFKPGSTTRLALSNVHLVDTLLAIVSQ